MGAVFSGKIYPKINLGLHVLGKRPDGYHNLETLFLKVENNNYFDEFFLEKSKTNPEIILSGSGEIILPENNLCYKAWHALKKVHNIGSFRLELNKGIPSGAGLGGGSADAGMMLQALNKLYDCNLTSDELLIFARQLGSDVPFFVFPDLAAFATGTGTDLEPYNFPIDLNKYEIRLYPQSVHSDTRSAYAGLNLNDLNHTISLKELLKKPLSDWKNIIFNDFEITILKKYPQLKTVKENLYHQGAVYALMTGSGSAFFAIFEK